MEQKTTAFNKQEFDALRKQDIADYPFVKGRFVGILTSIHHMPTQDAEAAYEREAMFYKRAVNEDEKLRKCDNANLFSVFLEIAINNLSIQPGGKADAFIEPRNMKITRKGADGKPVEEWGCTASLNVSAYGELKMRIRAGQILRMNNPVVVYEGDRFQPRTNERGEMTVDYAPAIPRKSNTIIGCWVSMMMPGGFIDFKWLLAEDIERLRTYSIPKSKRGDATQTGNTLYRSNGGQIDPGFLETKTIKHAMKTCLKIRTSDSVTFDGEDEVEAAGGAFDTFDTPEAAGTTEPQTTTVEPEDDLF